MTPQETLAAWRAEIAAELEQLESELVDAKATAKNAEAAYGAEQARWQELRRLAARSLPAVPGVTDGLAGPLYDRVECGRDEALKPLSRTRGCAQSRVKSIQSSIEGRRLALRQIDAAVAPAAGPSTVVEMASRRKTPAPLDFDTISMPQEAPHVTR